MHEESIYFLFYHIPIYHCFCFIQYTIPILPILNYNIFIHIYHSLTLFTIMQSIHPQIDFLYITHAILLLCTLSIPFWPKKQLQWGVYIPFIIAASWVLFQGCFITNIQTNLTGDTFTHNLLSKIYPSITIPQTDNILYFTYLLITIVGFRRLCK